MKKQLFALLLAALLLLTACGGPAQTATAEPTQAPVEKPAETAAPAPTAAPTAAPTEEPAPEEYQLEREPGCNQLSIYWTKDKIDIDTSDMWIWFKGKDGRSYPMHSCAYGAKVVINVPEDVEEVGFIVRTGCSDVGSSSWGTATKDFDGDRFVKMEGGDLSIFLKSGEETIYYSEDGGMNLQQKMNIKFAGIVAENQIKYTIEPAARLTSLDQVQVKVNGQPVAVEKLSSLNNEVITGVITTKEKIDITAECVVSIEGYGEKVAVPTAIFDSPAFEAMYTYSGDDLGAYIHGDTTTFKVWAPTASQVVLNLFEAGSGRRTTPAATAPTTPTPSPRRWAPRRRWTPTPGRWASTGIGAWSSTLPPRTPRALGTRASIWASPPIGTRSSGRSTSATSPTGSPLPSTPASTWPSRRPASPTPRACLRASTT